MNSNKLFNISEFSKICGLSRQTLIYYDRIGLFSPACVAENKYRMYAHNQIERISAITILSDLGVPLKRIKTLLSDVSPEKTKEVLNYQLEVIKEKAKKLAALQDMLSHRIEQINEGENKLSKIPCFSLVELKQNKPFYLGKRIDCLKNDVTDEIMIDFFKTIEKVDLPMIFAMGYLKNWTDVEKENFDMVRQMGFRMKSDDYANHFMPSGKYLVGYFKGDYSQTAAAYKEFLNYVVTNRLNAEGCVYEEYLIDELAQKKPDDFVFSLSVRLK